MRTDLLWVALTAFVLGACASQAMNGAPAADAHNVKTTAAAVIPAASVAPVVAGSGKAWVHSLLHDDHLFVGRLHLEAEAKVPEHQDADLELIYVLEGSGTLTINGKSHEVSADTLIIMPAGATVSYTNGKQPFVGLQMFSPSTSAAKYGTWKRKE